MCKLSLTFSDLPISTIRFRMLLTMLSFFVGGSIIVFELLCNGRELVGSIGRKFWWDRYTVLIGSEFWYWCVAGVGWGV